ncbi:MAG: hypothetical protein FJX77_04150 [Armatimonadetes bacterium]|nr:hypothetical protein [Armatimonadota bacterium]
MVRGAPAGAIRTLAPEAIRLPDRIGSHAVQILDLYHSAEYLRHVARTVSGEGNTQATKQCRRLAHCGPRGLLSALQRVGDRVLTRRKAADVVTSAIHFPQTDQARRNHPE